MDQRVLRSQMVFAKRWTQTKLNYSKNGKQPTLVQIIQPSGNLLYQQIWQLWIQQMKFHLTLRVQVPTFKFRIQLNSTKQIEANTQFRHNLQSTQYWHNLQSILDQNIAQYLILNHSSVDFSVSSIFGPGFESQAKHLCFLHL